jgi:DNA topoisomerase III
VKQLIICEKSSVAKAVAIALGVKMKGGLPYTSDDRIIDAARGHLLGLAEPNAYDSRFLEWRAGDLPIVPDEFRSVPRDEDDARLNRLLDLIRSPEVGEVVNACDAAREGELIFKLIYQAAGVDKPVRRAWFSSLTPGAVRRAFEELRDDADMKGLEDEAFARDVGDWLVGINGTRAVTVAAEGDGGPELRKKAVSVGRVQTPTLRILVEREREIDEYVPEPYYRVMGVLGAGGPSSGSTFEAFDVDGEDAPFRFATEAEARAVADEAAGRPAVVQNWEAGNEEKPAPLPFDLATLQVEASRAFGWSADRTLREAQRLYEMQFISYPRTDSRFLTWDLKGQIKDALERVPEALPELGPVAEGSGRRPTTRRFRAGPSTRPWSGTITPSSRPAPSMLRSPRRTSSASISWW